MHTPYADPSTNRIYHALFCDDAQALQPQDGRAALADWQRALLGGPAFIGALRQLAEDGQGDARVRALAFRALAQHGQSVPRRELLGVVIEVPLESGLDTLAAYADGSVRFIHGSGHMTMVEGPNPVVEDTVRQLLAASQAVVNLIGPSDQPRRPAPSQNVRMSFIVSDGLYFGEGPMEALMADGMAGPVLRSCVALLNKVTSLATA
jgi:hypothetical protein